MNCGTVLYDKAYQFSSGQTIDKLLIVMCQFGNSYLVHTTTSQPGRRNRVPGCQVTDKPPTFFLPRGSCWFNKDTWVELHEINELDGSIHNYKKQDGTTIEHGDALPLELMKQILDCAIESDFIDGYYVDHLRMVRSKL